MGKLVGRIFLLVTGILLLFSGIYGTIAGVEELIALKDGYSNSAMFTGLFTLLGGIFSIMAGVGGIFSFIGFGPFRRFVGPFAIVTFVILVVDIVLAAINGGASWWVPGFGGLVTIFYFIGYILDRRS